jgi:hypothetical protein
MKKIIPLTIALTLSPFTLAASLSPKQLLSIKPGESLSAQKKKISGLKLEDSLKGVDYEIQTEGDIIQSIKIDFTSPVASQDYLTGATKGHCLVQPMTGDVPLNRVFFFDLENKSRYELTPKGMIKSILVQDIPGARANRECQFSDATKKINQSDKIKKVE